MTNRNTRTAILITIPLSHYCEKVRWALDRVLRDDYLRGLRRGLQEAEERIPSG